MWFTFTVVQGRDAGKAAEVRAVEFLKREVPAWSKENGCFSCHNKADAARALYRASQKGYRISADVLADTTAWLAEPQQWDKNRGGPGFSDQRLPNRIGNGSSYRQQTAAGAARKVTADQNSSGS